MSELVQLHLGKIFSDFRQRMEKLQDEILKGAQPIVRRNWALSVAGSLGSQYRWFKTGLTLQSAMDEFGSEGNRKFYRLGPRTFYAIFGEYGTGREGARTGGRPPVGYKYGQKPGMRARRFTRHALSIAKPQIELSAIRKVKQFAANATVN